MIIFAQRSIAIILGFVAMAALFVMLRFPLWYVVLGTIGVWMLLVMIGWRVLYVWERMSVEVLFIVWTAIFASTGLFFVVDWPILRTSIMIGTGLLSTVLFGWSISSLGYTTHIEKAYRRILMMLSVFNVYALLTTLFALHIFFQEIGFVYFAMVQTGITGIVTFLVWRLYYPITIKKSWFWLCIIMLIVFELCWAMQVLPLGYTVLGLLVTWVWYIVQLLFRFHISEAGVNWNKQRSFLIANGVLFLLILFLVRWI